MLLCDDAARKARIIREELRSLDDLCDLLGAGCVYDDEYAEIFSSFDEATAALLLGRIRAVWEEGALRPLDEIEWQEALANWFNRLGADCRERIRRPIQNARRLNRRAFLSFLRQSAFRILHNTLKFP